MPLIYKDIARSLSSISRDRSIFIPEREKRETASLGIDKSRPPVCIIGYGSQEAAPVKTAPYTENMADLLISLMNKEVAEKFKIKIYPKIIRPDFSRQGEDDPKNDIDLKHGVRNFENVLKVYRDHFIAVSTCLLAEKENPPMPFGVGGDHGMAAATLRAVVLSYGVRDICDGNIECSDEVREKIIDLRKEFIRNSCEETIDKIGRALDRVLESDSKIMDQWIIAMKRVGVVWFDAHGDINTPVDLSAEKSDLTTVVYGLDGRIPQKVKCPSTSGNFHGMPVATSMGFGPLPMISFGSKYANILPQNIAFIGLRDLDEGEKELIEKLSPSGLKLYDPEKVRKLGMITYVKLIQEFIKNGVDRIAIQHDVDGANASRYLGTGTPVGPGSDRSEEPFVSHDTLIKVLKILSNNFLGKIVSIDVAEGAAPRTDGVITDNAKKSRVSFEDAIATYNSTKEVICSFLGLDEKQMRELFPYYYEYSHVFCDKSYRDFSDESERLLEEQGLSIPLYPAKKEPPSKAKVSDCSALMNISDLTRAAYKLAR